MYSTIKYPLLAFFLVIWIFCRKSNAQESQIKSSIVLKVDSSFVLNAELGSMVISIHNDSDSSFMGQINLVLPPGLELLGKPERAISLAKGKSWYTSIKVRATKLYVLNAKEMVFHLRDKQGKLLNTSRVQLIVPVFQSIKLHNESVFQVLKNVGDSLYLKIRVSNSGSTNEQIKLLFSSPNRVGRSDFMEKSFFLKSSRDTVIFLSILQEKFMLARAQYAVIVSCLSEENDVFDQVTLNFSSLLSERDYRSLISSLERNLIYSPNYLEWQGNHMLSKRKTHFLRSEGKYTLGEGRISYAAVLTKLDGLTYPLLNNTFIDYEQRKLKITLGNFQEDLEQSLFGRGVRVQQIDTLKDFGFVIGLMERKSDLIAAYEQQYSGFSVFGKIQLGQFDPNRKYYEGQVIFDRNVLDSSSSLLWSNNFEIVPKKYEAVLRINGFLASGVQQYFGNNANYEQVKPSVALGVKMDSKWKKFLIQSENFYSSSYYPGNKRGSTHITQRIGKNWGRKMAHVRYTYMNYTPAFFGVQYINFSNEISRLEGTIFLPMTNFSSIGITPSYNQDRSIITTKSGVQDFRSQSWRLQSIWNKRTANLKHHINLIIEGAYLTNLKKRQSQLAFRADLNYNFQNFGLNANYQKGELQANDLMRASFFSSNVGNHFSIGMRYDGQLFEDKMLWSCTMTTNQQVGYSTSMVGSMQIRYRIRPMTEVTGMVQLGRFLINRNQTYFQENSRLGIRQLLNYQKGSKQRLKTGELRVFCFYDHNQNDVFDADDVPAEGYHFTINDMLLFTGKDGYAKFKNLPFGEYTLFFAQKGSFMSNHVTTILNRKSHLVEVPLKRGGTLKSEVLLEYFSGISMDADLNLDRFTLLAISSDKIYRIPSDQYGKFEQNLPEGEYELKLDDIDLGTNESWTGETIRVGILPGETKNVPAFVVKVKSKRVEVKRFGQ